jgi:hypothetical protein
VALSGCWEAVREPVPVIKGGLMNKLVIGIAAFVLLAAGGAMAGGALTDSSLDDNEVTTATGTTTTTTNDITTLGTTTTRTETGEDLRGPCDEAEHANDPRCMGGTVTGRDDDRHEDRSGLNGGRDHDREDNDHDEDRSGSNSGRG